jgi:hypothetical protein
MKNISLLTRLKIAYKAFMLQKFAVPLKPFEQTGDCLSYFVCDNDIRAEKCGNTARHVLERHEAIFQVRKESYFVCTPCAYKYINKHKKSEDLFY